MNEDTSKVEITKVTGTLEKWHGDDHSVPPFEKIITEDGNMIYHELDGKVLLDRRK